MTPETERSVGLCASCARSRVVRNRRGSTFWYCTLSEVDSRFPKYPELPVLTCAGYRAAAPVPGSEAEEGGS